jgi:tetratricopeptide (TPR) repeat protein
MKNKVKLLQQAIKYHRTGRLKKAESIYRAILKADPDHSDANHNLAVLISGKHNYAQALPYYKAALEANPGHAQYWISYIHALIESGDPGSAKHVLAKGMANGLSGDHADRLARQLKDHNTPEAPEQAEMDRVIQLFSGGRLDAAEQAAENFTRKYPGHAFGWKALGTILFQSGRNRESISCLEKALSISPDDADTHNSLGSVFKVAGKPEDALVHYDRALKLNDTYAKAYSNRGIVLQSLGRFSEAFDSFEQAIHCHPDLAEAHFNYGNALKEQAMFTKAIHHFQRAIDIKPDFVDAYINLGATFLDMFKPDEAFAYIAKALELDPLKAQAHNNLGKSLHISGDFNVAVNSFNKALDIEPGLVDALHGKMSILKTSPEDPAFEQLGHVLSDSTTSNQDIMTAHFTLGKMYADIGQYDAAFDHYRSGHCFRKKYLAHSYDHENCENILAVFRENMRSGFFQENNLLKNGSDIPIFIIGFPRSGTTLLEQILSSHSSVFGAGELPDIGKMASSVLPITSRDRSGRMCDTLSGETLEKLSHEYLTNVKQISGNARRVVDKMPHNFVNLWLISLLCPRAVVLHAVRNPVDTCLSCFFQNFIHSHAYTDDLVSLGRHYVFYRQLMAHWRSELPIRIHDVCYETLVADPETQIRQLLAICGLPFEDQCLEFHRNKRYVTTASSVQVRQNEKHLGPLLEELGEYATWQVAQFPFVPDDQG